MGMENDSVSTWASRLAGGGATAYSLLTDYELGARRILPMPVHLTLDAVIGALLAATPWVAGEAERGTRYWLPHAVTGGSEVLLAAITQTEPPRETLTGKLVRKVGLTGVAKTGRISAKGTARSGARLSPLKLVSAAPGSARDKARRRTRRRARAPEPVGGPGAERAVAAASVVATCGEESERWDGAQRSVSPNRPTTAAAPTVSQAT